MGRLLYDRGAQSFQASAWQDGGRFSTIRPSPPLFRTTGPLSLGLACGTTMGCTAHSYRRSSAPLSAPLGHTATMR
jgi:hypothetical protein